MDCCEPYPARIMGMGMLRANTGAAFQAGDDGSVVRRDFVSQAARFSGNRRLQLLAQHSQFLTQLLDLLLLAIDGAIERLEQIVDETQLDFEFGDARFGDVSSVVSGGHVISPGCAA